LRDVAIVLPLQRNRTLQPIHDNNSGPIELPLHSVTVSGVPRNFIRGEGSTNSGEDRGQIERGSGGGGPLVRGSGSSCNLVQEISFHIVKFS